MRPAVCPRAPETEAWGGESLGREGGRGQSWCTPADPSLAALMVSDGSYVLNGNWEVSPPGIYEAAGTHVVYTRATGPEETLHAAGPTSQDLLLQVWARPSGEGRAHVAGERIWGSLGTEGQRGEAGLEMVRGGRLG